MAKKKIEVIRNPDVETSCGLSIDSCSAYYDKDSKSIIVMGEITSKQKTPAYAEVQAVAYDTDGDIMAREYANWGSFGLMQSFQIDVDVSDFDQEPIKIKVYPSVG